MGKLKEWFQSDKTFKWVFILSGVLIGILISMGAGTTVQSTSNNSFCLSCHDKPEFGINLSQTSHAEMECLSCHTQGLIKDKLNGTKHGFNTVTGRQDPNDYAHIEAKKVTNDKCLSCHKLDNIKRDDYLKARHNGYERKEFDCTRCHDQKFVHGKL